MKRLWLILLLVFIGCASNWVTLELNDGTVLKGEVRTMNKVEENILFVTLDSTGMRIKTKDIEKSFVGRREVPIEQIEYSYKLIKPNKTVAPPSSPSDPNATQEVLKHLLDIYETNNQDVNTPSTPSILQTHLCKFDNFVLFTNGQRTYGKNATKFRLWICPSDNSHQFWLPD